MLDINRYMKYLSTLYTEELRKIHLASFYDQNNIVSVSFIMQMYHKGLITKEMMDYVIHYNY